MPLTFNRFYYQLGTSIFNRTSKFSLVYLIILSSLVGNGSANLTSAGVGKRIERVTRVSLRRRHALSQLDTLILHLTRAELASGPKALVVPVVPNGPRNCFNYRMRQSALNLGSPRKYSCQMTLYEEKEVFNH